MVTVFSIGSEGGGGCTSISFPRVRAPVAMGVGYRSPFSSSGKMLKALLAKLKVCRQTVHTVFVRICDAGVALKHIH